MLKSRKSKPFFYVCIDPSSSLIVSFCSPSFPFLGPGRSVALHSAVLLTLALDQDLDLDQDPCPDLTLIPPVDPAHVLTAGLILVHLILDVMGAVMDAHGQGPVLVQGLMVIAGLVHHDLLYPTAVDPGKEQKEQDHTGRGHDLVLLVATGAVALVGESHLLES